MLTTDEKTSFLNKTVRVVLDDGFMYRGRCFYESPDELGVQDYKCNSVYVSRRHIVRCEVQP